MPRHMIKEAAIGIGALLIVPFLLALILPA